MSSTQTVTEGGAVPDRDPRVARAMGEALQILDRAWSRTRRAEDVVRIREAFSNLAEAGQRVQEGALDNATWQHIGRAVMFADQIGRNPSR